MPAVNAALDDPERMAALAQRIKDPTTVARFERATFMPVTRDLSAGRRRLLHRWCDLVIDGDTPDAARTAHVKEVRTDIRLAQDLI